MGRAEAHLEPLTAPALVMRRGAPVTVGFALQKGDRAEWTVQKLTELGVDRIVPFVTEHTIVRLDQGAARRRGERLRKVARAAASQSRRVVLPEVGDPASLVEVLELEKEPVYFAEPGAGRPRTAMSCVFVGPEGGWSPFELSLGAGCIGLSHTVLRAETAAIAAGVFLVGLADDFLTLSSTPLASPTDSATL